MIYGELLLTKSQKSEIISQLFVYIYFQFKVAVCLHLFTINNQVDSDTEFRGARSSPDKCGTKSSAATYGQLKKSQKKVKK